MKKSLRKIMAALTIVAVTFMTGNTVFADSVTSVVMRYEDKVFTKEIYGTEVEEIKNGAFTDGLRDISGLIDSLEYQMNGDVRINRNAVTDAVKSLIIAGQTSINIDLSRYKAGAGASTGTLPESNIAATASENNSQMVATGVTDPVVSPALDSLEIDTKLSEASTKFRRPREEHQECGIKDKRYGHHARTALFGYHSIRTEDGRKRIRSRKCHFG